MALNLLDAAKNLLSKDQISKAASSLGESEGNIQRAFNGAIPSILAGLLNKSSGTGADKMLDLAKAVAGTDILNNVSGYLDGNRASSPGGGGSTGVMVSGWLRSVFADKVNNIINAISGFAGIKLSSASAILNMAAPVALAPVGNYTDENNFTSSDLGSFLQSQKSSILRAIPAGFNLTGALGINSLEDIGGRTTEAISSAAGYAGTRAKNASSGNKWLWPLLLLVAIAASTWFFTQKGCKDSAPGATADTTTTKIGPAPVPIAEIPKASGMLDTVTGNYIYDTGKEAELKLPDGSVLKVGENSTEAKLYSMLSDVNWSIDTADKTKNWVTFNRVFFEKGKSVLTAESQSQIKNVAAILKNFPSGSIKIGGYTDNAGDTAVNKRISDSRAKIVMKELIKSGAGVKQITEAVGYGPEHPVCAANDTPECKAQNRRVDLKVASK